MIAFEGTVWKNCRTGGILWNSARHIGYVDTMRGRWNILTHCRADRLFGNSAEQIGYLDTLLDGEDIVTLLGREGMWALYWKDGVSGHWCKSGDMRTLCWTDRISAHCWTDRIFGNYAGLICYLQIAGQIGYPDSMVDWKDICTLLDR
jgi:hypothetical protein